MASKEEMNSLKRTARIAGALTLIMSVPALFAFQYVGSTHSFIVLMLLSGADYLAAFETDQLHALVQLFSNAQEIGHNIGIVFVFLGAGVFAYLLLKSNYIPRILAVWGILAYSVALVVTFAILMLPTPSPMLEYLPYLPAMGYELVLGLWLLFKGVDVRQRNNRALESA